MVAIIFQKFCELKCGFRVIQRQFNWAQQIIYFNYFNIRPMLQMFKIFNR